MLIEGELPQRIATHEVRDFFAEVHRMSYDTSWFGAQMFMVFIFLGGLPYASSQPSSIISVWRKRIRWGSTIHSFAT